MIGALISTPIIILFPTYSIFVIFIATIIISYLSSCLFLSLFNRLSKNWSKTKSKLFVLALGVILFFPLIGYSNFSHSNIESVMERGCVKLRQSGCDSDNVASIDTGIDLTGDGIYDNLLTVCRIKFGTNQRDKTITTKFCRNKCCHILISEELNCKQDLDCTSAIGGKGWICDLETYKCKQK
ncbi:MAG: hypothetical protein KAU95_02310 [Candidatus Aenigmarchaeota archaeon]|nr:hypothetical protein [Candidatus Aenigmarchaeota archaeon]